MTTGQTISYWKVFLIKFFILVGVNICLTITAALAGLDTWGQIATISKVMIIISICGNAGLAIVSLIDKSFTRLSDGMVGIAGVDYGDPEAKAIVIPQDNGGQGPVKVAVNAAGNIVPVAKETPIAAQVVATKQTIGETLKG